MRRRAASRSPVRPGCPGRIALDALELGGLRPTQVEARIDAEGTTSASRTSRPRLAGGTLTGSGQRRLGTVGRAPFSFDLRGAATSTPRRSRPRSTCPHESVVGRGFARVRIAGVAASRRRLRDRRRARREPRARRTGPSRSCRAWSRSRGCRRCPVSAVCSGRPLPYDSARRSEFTLANGKLGLLDAKLLGPQLRMLGSRRDGPEHADQGVRLRRRAALPADARHA